MDREAIKTNSQKLRWIEIAITAVEKGRSRGSRDSLAVERYREAVEIALKTIFQRKEKHRHECNQTCNSTKDPNNILSFQNHLSTGKILST